MILDRIIRDSGSILVKGDGKMEITAICNDSRKVTPGSVFIAVKGYASDGHEYISTAIGKGACAIVYEDQESAERQVAAAGKEVAMIKHVSPCSSKAISISIMSNISRSIKKEKMISRLSQGDNA